MNSVHRHRSPLLPMKCDGPGGRMNRAVTNPASSVANSPDDHPPYHVLSKTAVRNKNIGALARNAGTASVSSDAPPTLNTGTIQRRWLRNAVNFIRTQQAGPQGPQTTGN